MSSARSRWPGYTLLGLLLLATVYGASLHASQAPDCASAALEVEALQGDADRLERERRELQAALQSCEAGTDRGSERVPAAPSPASNRTAYTPPSTPSLTLEQGRSMLRLRYGQLLRELALTPEQSEALLGALATLDPSAGLLPQELPDAARETAAIARVVGPEKAAQFAQLKLTLRARAELRVVRDRLEQAGDELTQPQLDQLLQALNGSAREFAAPPPAASPDETPEQRVRRYRDWSNEREVRFRTVEAALLTPSQVQLLDAGRVPLHLLTSSGSRGQAGGAG